MGLESSISWNIRNFFRVIFFFFLSMESSLLNIFKLNARNKIPLPEIQKNPKKTKKERKFKNFFNLGAKKLYFPKYKNFFFWKNVKRFSRADFLFFELRLKSASGDLIFCYYWNGEKLPLLDIFAFSSACFGLKMKHYHLKFSL